VVAMSKLPGMLLPLLLLAPAPERSPMAAQDGKTTRFAVVAHQDNAGFESVADAKATVKKLYLKELTQWPGGVEARPYARERQSQEQAAFVKDVLGMTDAELARHWLRLKNASGTTPPKDVDSERLLLKFVARNQGAFGVVALDAARSAEGVKVLFEF